MGLIVRTAGETAKTQELAKDMKYLLKLWETLNQAAVGQSAPCLLHRDLDLITGPSGIIFPRISPHPRG